MNLGTDLDKIETRIAKHFESPYCFNMLHGSDECCFENIAFRIGNSQYVILNKEVSAFFDFYLKKFVSSDELMNNDFVRTIMLNGLLYMGNKLDRIDEAIVEAFYMRLDRVYDFAISNQRIFYTDEERKHIKSIPAVWKNAPVVRYEHTNPYLCLPVIYDMLGFSVMYGKDKEADDKIDRIIEYIFSTQYQETVKAGYGIGINGENGFLKSRIYAVGWDVGLSRSTPKQEFLYMILFSHISGARGTKWYQANIEKYRGAVESGDDSLLLEICTSIRKTYWTGGCFLDFGRSKKEKLERVMELITVLSERLEKSYE